MASKSAEGQTDSDKQESKEGRAYLTWTTAASLITSIVGVFVAALSWVMPFEPKVGASPQFNEAFSSLGWPIAGTAAALIVIQLTIRRIRKAHENTDMNQLLSSMRTIYRTVLNESSINPRRSDK